MVLSLVLDSFWLISPHPLAVVLFAHGAFVSGSDTARSSIWGARLTFNMHGVNAGYEDAAMSGMSSNWSGDPVDSPCRICDWYFFHRCLALCIFEIFDITFIIEA